MKKFNFLTNKMKWLFVPLVLLTLGVGSAWGVTAVDSQTPSNGASYILALYYSSNYYALPHFTTNGATQAGKLCTLNASGQVTAISGESSPDNCLWTLTSATGGYKISYTSGNTTNYLGKAGSTGNSYTLTSNSTNNDDKIWSFTKGTANSVDAYKVFSLKPTATKHRTMQGNGSSTFQVRTDDNIYAITLLPVAPAGPTITTSSSMTTFGCNMTTGVPVKQSFTVSGTALTNNVTVTPPSGYEVCLTENGTYTSSVELSKGSGTLSATTVYVKLKDDNAAGSYSGNIACTSSGATTKNVAVSGSTPFTVTWKANGSTYATTYVTYASGTGTAIGTLPTEPDPDDYCGDAFYGWYDGNSYKNASVAPSIISTSTKITSDKTYNAVFADAEDGSQTSTLTASAQGWSDGTNATTKTISTVTYTWAQNSGTSAPKYYATGTAVRLYAQTSGTNGNQVTISSSNTITRIVFTYVEDYEFLTNAPSVGTLTAAGVWSGSATSITFKNKNNAQVRIQSIVVTYGGISYSNYDTSCASCDANPSIGAASLNGSIS